MCLFSDGDKVVLDLATYPSFKESHWNPELGLQLNHVRQCCLQFLLLRILPTSLFNRPFPLEELEITVDHVEGDLPPARPGGGQQLNVPLIAVYGALGVELEAQREVLLPDLVEPREAIVPVQESALGEPRDEVSEALVVGERGPHGLERRVDANPSPHEAPVPLPDLGHLDMEADALVAVLLFLVLVVVRRGPVDLAGRVSGGDVERRVGRGGDSAGREPRGRGGGED